MKPCALLFLTILSLSVSASGNIYQWTDKKGNIHFSDKAHKKAKKIDIQKRGKKNYYKWYDKKGYLHLSDKPHKNATVIKLPKKTSIISSGKKSAKKNQQKKNAYNSIVDKRTAKEKIDSLINDIQSQQPLSIYYQDKPAKSWPTLSYKLIEKKDYPLMLRYLKIIKKEFDKYPSSFLQHTKLRGIVLVKSLKIGAQRRGAVPDYYQELLYYDIGYLRPDNEHYIQHIIHHEFYHMIEQELNGDAYYKDPNWSALNPYNFKYGKGGANYRSKESLESLRKNGLKGFVSAYAKSGLEEDKAETYACLLTKRCIRYLKKRIKNDDVLKRKVEHMKTFLYLEDSNINEHFWKKHH